MTPIVTSVHVLVDEFVVIGRTRQWADRFHAALELQLSAALAEVPAVARAVQGRSAAAGSLAELAVTVQRPDRRDPGQAAVAVAAGIARILSDGAWR